MCIELWTVTSFSKSVGVIKDIIWQILGFVETPKIKENDKSSS
jgi:hypothetical protein